MGEDTFHLGIKALIRDSGGKILLLQVNTGKLSSVNKTYWDLPGGRVQKNQSVATTLKREMAKETGISDIRVIREVCMTLSNIRIPLSKHVSVGLILGIYECQIPEAYNVILSNEHVAYDWFAPSEAAKLLTVKYPEQFCNSIADL